MPWLQQSAPVHHLFGSRLERHATTNTVGDYSVQFSTGAPPPPTSPTPPPIPPPSSAPPPLPFSVLVVYPCQSCQLAAAFYLTSPPFRPDFFIKRQPFTQILEKIVGGKLQEKGEGVAGARDKAAWHAENRTKWEEIGWVIFLSFNWNAK